MPEVFTCDCGNQTWVIYRGKVECSVCKIKYCIYKCEPNDFNQNRNIYKDEYRTNDVITN